MEKCPKCESTDVESYEIAHYIKDGDPVKYMGDEPDRYKCKKCDLIWTVKK